MRNASGCANAASPNTAHNVRIIATPELNSPRMPRADRVLPILDFSDHAKHRSAAENAPACGTGTDYRVLDDSGASGAIAHERLNRGTNIFSVRRHNVAYIGCRGKQRARLPDLVPVASAVGTTDDVVVDAVMIGGVSFRIIHRRRCERLGHRAV